MELPLRSKGLCKGLFLFFFFFNAVKMHRRRVVQRRTYVPYKPPAKVQGAPTFVSSFFWIFVVGFCWFFFFFSFMFSFGCWCWLQIDAYNDQMLREKARGGLRGRGRGGGGGTGRGGGRLLVREGERGE